MLICILNYVLFLFFITIDGFENLKNVPTLKLLDLQKNGIDWPLQQFENIVILTLRRLPKLQYLSFEQNPIESKTPNFRYYIIYNLPKLEYYNYIRITKEERQKANQIAETIGFNNEGFRKARVLTIPEER